jgi:hypothetical protein
VHEIQTEAGRRIESLLAQLARQEQQLTEGVQAEKETVMRAERAEIALATIHERAGELELQLQQVRHS